MLILYGVIQFLSIKYPGSIWPVGLLLNNIMMSEISFYLILKPFHNDPSVGSDYEPLCQIDAFDPI